MNRAVELYRDPVGPSITGQERTPIAGLNLNVLRQDACMNTDSSHCDGLDLSQGIAGIEEGVEMLEGGARRRQVGPAGRTTTSNRSSGTPLPTRSSSPARSWSL